MATLAKVGNVPDYQDIEIYRGADFTLPFALVNASGTPVNISGFTITAQIRRQHMGAVVDSFSVVIESASQGHFYIALSASQTAALKCGEQPRDSASRYWWDVRVLNPSPAPVVGYARHGEAFVYAGTTRP